MARHHTNRETQRHKFFFHCSSSYSTLPTTENKTWYTKDTEEDQDRTVPSPSISEGATKYTSRGRAEISVFSTRRSSVSWHSDETLQEKQFLIPRKPLTVRLSKRLAPSWTSEGALPRLFLIPRKPLPTPAPGRPPVVLERRFYESLDQGHLSRQQLRYSV